MCVSKLCLCVSKLCVSKLYVSKLCASKLCVDKLCVEKLCVNKLCEREAAGGGRRQPGVDDQKTRTSHKDVGKKNEHELPQSLFFPGVFLVLLRLPTFQKTKSSKK